MVRRTKRAPVLGASYHHPRGTRSSCGTGKWCYKIPATRRVRWVDSSVVTQKCDGAEVDEVTGVAIKTPNSPFTNTRLMPLAYKYSAAISHSETVAAFHASGARVYLWHQPDEVAQSSAYSASRSERHQRCPRPYPRRVRS